MSVAIGTTLAHFKILAKIGAGGMGEVYRATDTKLGRDVAFKVLPEAMASDPERLSRFQREAKAVAALSHPNIVTLFSVDEADGVHFLTMELVAGQPLTGLLPSGGFSLDQFFALAIPIADAVASAHSRGVVHRDLKPDNVMVDDEGRVKILDFGLAKVVPSPLGTDLGDDTSSLTVDGRIMGTAPYMSPEQVQGKPVDARSDIFSLGVMLYQMAAGRRPFVGGSFAEVMAAVQRDHPVALDLVRHDLPRRLGHIVGRCLEKSPNHRYPSASDVRNQLVELQREVGSWTPSAGAVSSGAVSGSTATIDGTLVLKTLLVTDLVASTRMVEALGDERTAEVMSAHDRMVRDLLASRDGREIDKTDGFLLLFDRPVDAVRFAVVYHRRLATLGREQGIELRARAGIHVGEVVLRANSSEDVALGAKPLEVEGLAKPTAARLMSLAQGGQTLLTQGAFDLARRAAVGTEGLVGLRWQSHGVYQMKGIEEPVGVFEVGEEAQAPLRPPRSSDKVTRLATAELSRDGASISLWRRRRWLIALAVMVAAVAAIGLLRPGSDSRPPSAPAPAAVPLDRSIAVLPFENRSDDETNEYFSDGLSEELLNMLAQVPGLRVAARTSSFYFKGRTSDISEIGRQLKVSVILEGSVRKAGNRIKVSASLVDVAEGFQLWAQTYDREMHDVFALQEEIATTVVEALKITLIGDRADGLVNRPTDNLAAYEAYLLGRHRQVSRNSTSLEEALTYFDEALRLDPEFAQAHAGRAMTLAMLGFYALRPPEDFLAEAEASVLQALELAPHLGEAHAVLGYLRHRTGRDIEAGPSFERALELNPTFLYTYLWRGNNLARLGRNEQARAIFERGLQVDPLDPTLHAYKGWILTMLGRWDEALAAFQRATEIDSDHATALAFRGWLHALDGRFDLAVRCFRQAVEADAGSVLPLSALSWAYLSLGDLEQAGKWNQRLESLAPGNRWSANSRLVLYRARGERGPMLAAAKETLSPPVADFFLALALRELTQADLEAGRHSEALSRYRSRLPGLFEDPPELAMKLQYNTALESAVDLAALMLAMGDQAAAERLLDHCLAALKADPRPTSALRVFNPLAEPALHAVRGDKEAALAALRDAIDRGPLLQDEPSGGWRGNPRDLLLHPHLRILQEEPEFQAMVAEVEADLARIRQALEGTGLPTPGR